jgi:mono/diheme cytochrome c family protein
MKRHLIAAGSMYVAATIVVSAQAPVRTVWDGVYTAEQAARGKSQYATSCARCHGGSLEGGMGASLVGTAFWNKWREQSVGDLLGYVSQNMPMGVQAAVLSPPVYADVVAYLLSSNDLPPGSTNLSATSGTDAQIVPKGGSTGELPPGTLTRVVGCLMAQEADRSWRVVKASKPERVKAIAGAVTDTAGGDRQYPLKYVLQPLAPLAGHKVAVVGLLLGEGGADGINVSTVTSVATACD